MELLVPVDPSAQAPLHRQVYDGVRSAILSGHLHPGDRLPATRALAEQLSLSRQTVTDAYDQLQAEGYIHGRRGSGTYVAPDLPTDAVRMPRRQPSAQVDRQERLAPWGHHVANHVPSLPAQASVAVAYDLRPHRIAPSIFPWEVWSAAVDRALTRSRAILTSPAPPQGHAELREAVAAHVTLYRAVECSADQVVIVSGSQQGLNLLSQLLLDRGNRVAVEDPGYPSARVTFEARELDVLRVPVDGEGMVVDALAGASPLRMVHVTPSHQDPTGATLSLGRRLSLLDIAQRRGALIFEDDYDSEFRYEGRPVESLQGLDTAGLVVYAGTFSKSVLAGLRIGYLVLPSHLVEAFVSAKRLWDSGTPMLEQAALAEFMRSGDFERHIRRMRRVYRSRRDALLEALALVFGDRARVGPRHGGLNVLVELDVPGTAEEIAARAERAGVALRPVTQYYRDPPSIPSFLLGFGALSEREIAEAINVVGRLTLSSSVRSLDHP